MAAEKHILQELGEQAPELAKLLGNTKMEAPYKVPDGYFDTIKIPVAQAPVKSISFGNRVFKYAVAAAITGIIAVAVWFTMHPAPVKNTPMLANNMDSISDDEIEKYIDGDISVYNYEPGNSASDIKEEDLTLMLSEIPDKELEGYLN
jgi:hypothetical protein